MKKKSKEKISKDRDATWEYRVLKTKLGYGIIEVYRGINITDGDLYSEPVEFYDSIEDIADDYALRLIALMKPVMKIRKEKLYDSTE